jgi:regulator of cell morphogenesis and NO signaling
LKSLIDYILQTYHTFTRKQGSLLLNYTEKLLNAHADTYKEVTELKNLVTTLVEELMTHLLKEERVLFPAILAMLDDKPLPFEKSHIIHPIQAMEFEHEQAGNLLKQITSLTNHFSPPEHACTTWKVCYSTLKEFTEDLYKHIHLENNLLFTQVWSMIKV